MRHAENYIVVLSGLIIFSPLLDGGTTHVAVMGIRLFVILLGCLFLTRSLRKKMVAWPSLPLDGVVTSCLALAAVSVALSAYKEASFQWFMILLIYGGLLYLFVYFVDGWEHIATIVAVMAVMGLFEAGLAVHQMSWGRVIRPTGTFFNPNFLAGYLASIGSIALGMLCYDKLWSRLPGGLRMIPGSTIATTFMLGGAFSLMFAAVVLSGSRAGLLAFLVGIMVVAGIRFGWKGAVILTGFLLSAFVLIPNPVYDRLRAEHVVNPETYARWNIWQSSVSAILDHPSGAGLGLYQYVYPRYAVPIEGMISRYGRLAQTAHNEYLQTGAELGIAGLMVLFWGIGVLFREARLVMNQRLGRRQRGMVIGVVGGTTSILFHAALDSNLHEPAIAIMLVLCTGILFSAKQLKKSGHCLIRRQSLESRTVRLLWVGGGTLVAMTLFLGALQPGLAWMAYEDGARAAREKDHHTAIARYEAAITLEPGKSLYHSSLAASYFMTFEQTGDPALSEATLRELAIARHLNPLDGRLWGLEGYVYRSLSDHQHVVHAREPASAKQLMDWRFLARVAYEHAVVLEPFNPMHYLELARLHHIEGHREQALAVLRQATAIEPNFLPAREWLVRMYLESGETDRAQAEYREILDRRDRFKHTMKNAFEAQFLSVDVNALEAAIASSKGRT